MAINAKPLAEHGGDRKSEEANQNQPSYTKVDSGRGYGETAEYLIARIARDAPEVHEKLKAGKYSSARAAAIDTGILKPRVQFTVGHSTKPEAFAE